MYHKVYMYTIGASRDTFMFQGLASYCLYPKENISNKRFVPENIQHSFFALASFEGFRVLGLGLRV